MARTLAWGARGRSFKSSHPDMLYFYMEEIITQTGNMDSSEEITDNISETTSSESIEQEKANIIDRIRDKCGIEKDNIVRGLKRSALIAGVVTVMLTSSGCFSSEPYNPFLSNSPEQALAAENVVPEISQDQGYVIEKEMVESTEMEEVWNRALEFWPNSRFNEAKEYFFEEARKYSEIYPKYSPELLLPTFLSVAMTESNGGNDLGPNYVGARGWFQVIPDFHLSDFNATHEKN